MVKGPCISKEVAKELGIDVMIYKIVRKKERTFNKKLIETVKYYCPVCGVHQHTESCLPQDDIRGHQDCIGWFRTHIATDHPFEWSVLTHEETLHK